MQDGLNDLELSEEDGLDAGFAGDVGETPKADDPPAQEQPKAEEPKQEQPATPPAEPTLDPQLEKLVRNLVEGRLRNYSGEVNQKFTEFEKKFTPSVAVAAAAATRADGNAAPTQNQITTAMQSSEKFKRLKEDFPEWGEAIEEQLNVLASQIDARVGTVQSPQIDTSNFVTRDALHQAEETMLTAVRPGWKEQISSAEFATWFNSLPDSDVKSRVRDGKDTVLDAMQLLDQFTSFKKPPSSQEQPTAPKTDKTQRLRAAVIPTRGGNSPPATSMSEDEAMEFGYKNG